MMPMEMYQHDSATAFRFVLRGDLIGDQIQDLEHAWTTAKSILKSKELVVDVSGVTHADQSGVDLLSRMRDSGACLTAVLPPKSAGLLRSLGLSAAAPSGRFTASRLLRLFWRTAVPASTYQDLGGDQHVNR
jgi:ABC-type transporter Mla MlaB component